MVLDRFPSLSDTEVCEQLCKLPGIGIWTAEMVLIHSLQRPNILSQGDLGIQRGMRKLYNLDIVTSELFSSFRDQYSPCATVASLYLWEIAGGALQ